MDKVEVISIAVLKVGVYYCRYITTLYLAFIVRNLFLNGYKYRGTIKINSHF